MQINWWQYLRGLFQEAEQSSPSQPVIHEVIARSEAEKADYTQWKEALMRRRLINWLSDQYAIFSVLPADIDEALDFLDTPSSKGFAVHFYKTNYTRREVIFLSEYLKEQVLALNYRSQISDTRTYNRPQWVETVERHYLKPRYGAPIAGKLKQRFGNITIEVLLRNDQVHQLKFRATIYKDHLFHAPEDFHELMQSILD